MDWIRTLAMVSLFAVCGWLTGELSAEEVEAATPGTTWEEIKPGDAGLDAAKLTEFSSFVGGRGCVVRHGYLVHSWGDVSLRADVASACKPFYSHFLFKAVEDGRIGSLNEKVVRWEPRLQKLNEQLEFKDAEIMCGISLTRPRAINWSKDRELHSTTTTGKWPCSGTHCS